MSISIPKSFVHIAAVLIAAVVLLWAVAAGSRTGKNQAAAESVAKTAGQLTAGLRNFFSDQERYPTAAEFQDQNLMLNYFNAFPPAQIAGGNCQTDFSYLRPSPQSFKLQFCLAAPAGTSRAGWNQLTQDDQ